MFKNKTRRKLPTIVEIQRALHTYEALEKKIILQGNPIDGYIPIGTFMDEDEAREYAKSLNDTYIITDLIDPYTDDQ